MARKNANAGQPNRAAQVERRKKTRVHLELHTDFRRSGRNRSDVSSCGPTDLRYDRVVLGPLSEHLTPSKKPHGELVERVHFEVFA